MDPKTWTTLPERDVIAVSGNDARSFLQGLVTNDIDLVSPARSVYASLLTPQGKFLHDFFVVELKDTLLIECDRARSRDLARRLRMYRLRAAVEIRHEVDSWAVIALPSDEKAPGDTEPLADGVVFVDPRTSALGCRAIIPETSLNPLLRDLCAKGFREVKRESLELKRIRLGIPEGSLDLLPEKTLALEGALDRFDGVSFTKGCYVGQEVTARMKHRNLVRRRIVPVTFEGPAPAPGTPVMCDGIAAGEIRSGIAGHAIALIRLDLMEKGGLVADGRPLTTSGTMS